MRVNHLPSQFISMIRNGNIKKFTWRIKNFSSITGEKLYTDFFYLNGCRWQIVIYPNGDDFEDDDLLISLACSYRSRGRGDQFRYAQFGLAVINQIDRKLSKTEVDRRMFGVNHSFTFSFLALSEFHNPDRGYLVYDECLIEAYITTCKTDDLISHEFIVASYAGPSSALSTHPSSWRKPAPISTQPSSEKTTTASSTPPSSQSVATEPEDPSEEDISTFFTNLESELSSSCLVFSQEAAKDALDKLHEALNMTPVNFHDSGKFSLLKQSFKILAKFDCYSTTLTIEQKNELLDMEESLKELADKAAKVMQDKKCISEKESTKLAITRNLEGSLTKYKEVESEVKQVDQTLAALHEQLEEAQKKRENILAQLEEAQNKRENILAERKDIFRSSKRLKIELEDFGDEWAEYEAKAKVAEAEEKTIETKWGRMKDFVSSLKGMI